VLGNAVFLVSSKPTLMHRLILFIIGISFYSFCKAQLPQNAFSFNCTKDTTLACGQSCLTLQTTVPAIRALSDRYTVNKAACFKPNISPSAPGTSSNLGIDDVYTPVIPLPFDFPFYGIIYGQLVISTNGIISFDLSNANLSAQWTIPNGQGSLPSNSYDRAVIMGAFHDVDIQFPSTSPSKQIKYDVTGTAPHRKWILTFYKVPCYESTCWNKINNTYQISLYEGLGLVEIHLFEREICTVWNNGNAMIGMQNYNRDNGIMAPGRSAWTTPRWGGLNMNEAWRFAPNTGPSLLKKVELYKSTGELVATGDTTNDGNGNYLVSFDNICPDSTAAQYIVKSSYYNFQYPFQFPAADSIIYSTDTINVVKQPIVSIQNACPGQANGKISIINPVGPGYTYNINNSPFQVSHEYPFLSAGMYEIGVREPGTGCYSSVTVNVPQAYNTNTQVSYPQVVYCTTAGTTPSPAINGVTGGRFSASPSLLIDSVSGVINLTSADAGIYTITYRINSSDSCINPVATANVVVADSSLHIWTGVSDILWGNPSNWSCNSVPTSTSNVLIYSGTVAINSNVTVNKLTVMPGANLTVWPTHSLTILNP